MVWKSAVLAVPESAGFTETLHILTVQPMLYLLLLLFGIQFVCWILLLSRTDLSYAQPITAFCCAAAAPVGLAVPLFAVKTNTFRRFPLLR
jgi:hypothetical protein